MCTKKYDETYTNLETMSDDSDHLRNVKETTSLITGDDRERNYLEIDDVPFSKDRNKFKEFFDTLKRRNWKKGLKDFKIGFVFLIVVILTSIIALQPIENSGFSQFSVFKAYAPILSRNITKAASVLRVKLRGSLLLAQYGKYANVTLVVKNVECQRKNNFSDIQINEDMKKKRKNICLNVWTIPVQYPNEKSQSESILTKYFTLDKRFLDGPIQIQLITESLYPLPIGINDVFLTHSVENQVIYAAAILLGVYVLIIFDLVHRSVAAIIGSLAALAVMSSFNLRPSLETVVSWLDFETLTLLFGMMLIVGIFSETGFFDWIAFKAYQLAKGQPWPLLILLCTFSAFISAFLDNVTTVLLLTPVTIRLCEALKMDPKRILIAEVIFSNIGGTATAIGDPPNVILVSSKDLQSKGIKFTNFTLHMSIGTIVIFVVCLIYLRLFYGEITASAGDEDSYRIVEIKREIEVWRRTAYSITIASQEEAAIRALLLEKVVQLEHKLGLQQHNRRPSVHFRENLHKMKDQYVIKDKWLLIKCSFVLTLVIIAFFISSLVPGFHLDLGWISFLGAVWIIVLSDFADFETIVEKVEWATLIFFAALFALMRALEELSLISWIGDQVSILVLQVPTEYRLLITLLAVLWLSAVASSFIDNIPFTTAMIPVVMELGNYVPLLPLVWALAFGACLGGNGTLIGASANVVVAGVAQQHGYSFTFMEFFKVGFPIMVLSTTISMIYLLICHMLIGWNYS